MTKMKKLLFCLIALALSAETASAEFMWLGAARWVSHSGDSLNMDAIAGRTLRIDTLVVPGKPIGWPRSRQDPAEFSPRPEYFALYLSARTAATANDSSLYSVVKQIVRGQVYNISTPGISDSLKMVVPHAGGDSTAVRGVMAYMNASADTFQVRTYFPMVAQDSARSVSFFFREVKRRW